MGVIIPGLIFTAQMNEIIETLSAAKAPKTDGKGNLYVDGLFWFYGVYEDKSCVETISKESRGEASSKRRGLPTADKI